MLRAGPLASLLDHSVFSVIHVAIGDWRQSTYDLAVAAGR
jgi:hypothetical protein